MSRKLRSLVLILLLLGSPVRPASASPGDYHQGETLDCSDCHVMHPVAATPGAVDEQSVGPLLREDVNDLCLACHDGSRKASDVLGWNQGRNPGDVRQAGSLNRLGVSGLPSTGHTLDSLETAPGSSPPWRAEDENGGGHGLSCVNCHQHHGSQGGFDSYRNLRADAGNNRGLEGLVTYNHEQPGLNNLSRDVFVRRPLSYDESALDFNEPDPRDSAMGRFCAGCHNLFHGVPGQDASIGGERDGNSYQRFVRHPVAGVNLGRGAGMRSSLALFAAHGNRVKVMSEVGVWSPPGSDVTPTCITCHKAHGNGNSFGLILRSGSGSLSENGDSGGGAIEDLCRQCHGSPGS